MRTRSVFKSIVLSGLLIFATSCGHYNHGHHGKSCNSQCKDQCKRKEGKKGCKSKKQCKAHNGKKKTQ